MDDAPSSRPHSTVEVPGGDNMDWDLAITSPASVSTQYSEVTSPSGDIDQVPSFATEVEVCSNEDGTPLSFSMKYNSVSGKVEPEGANNKQLWNSLSEEARKGIINMFQHKAASKSEDSVNDLKKYKADIENVIDKDVQKIAVKVLRKIIPEMRIFCYLSESQYMGKRKLKHLWDKESQPKDWPREVPFLDPNNGDRNGPKTNTTAPMRGKPGKETLIKMFDFLKKKYQTLNTSQPVEEEGGIAYSNLPAEVVATPTALPKLGYTGTMSTPMPITVVPLPDSVVYQHPAPAVPVPAQTGLYQGPRGQSLTQVKPFDTTSDVVDSMYERLGSKFNHVAQLATHHQDAQILLHNLICAMQEMYSCNKKVFLEIGHRMEGFLDLVLYNGRQENWQEFMQQCRGILDQLVQEPVKSEPQSQMSTQPKQEPQLHVYNVQLETNINPFEAGLKPDFAMKGFSFSELLKGDEDAELTEVKKEFPEQCQGKWQNTQQRVSGSEDQSAMPGFGVQWRQSEPSSLDMKNIIEDRAQDMMFVDIEDEKRGETGKLQDLAERDTNFKDSMRYTGLLEKLSQALKPSPQTSSDPMWNSNNYNNTKEDDDVLNDILGLEEDYMGPEPSSTLQMVASPTQQQPPSPAMPNPRVVTESTAPASQAAVLPGINDEVSASQAMAAPSVAPSIIMGVQSWDDIVAATATACQPTPVAAPVSATVVAQPTAEMFEVRGVPQDLIKELSENLDVPTLRAVLSGESTIHLERPNGQVITIDMGADPPVSIQCQPAAEEMDTNPVVQQMTAPGVGTNNWQSALMMTECEPATAATPHQMAPLAEGPPMQVPFSNPAPIPLVVQDLEMSDDDNL